MINEKYGSYVYVADLVCSVEPQQLFAKEPQPIKRCIGCRKCISSCPTKILAGEGSDCLSAITQRKGTLSDSEIDLMRKFNTVWGCDECQRYCPYNMDPVKTPVSFFYRDRITRLTPSVLEGLSDDAFSSRAFAWRKRATVERNLSYFDFSGESENE